MFRVYFWKAGELLSVTISFADDAFDAYRWQFSTNPGGKRQPRSRLNANAMARHYCKCAISPMAEARDGAHNTASGPPNVPRKGEPLPSSMDRWRPRLTGDCRVGEQKEARPGRCRPWRAGPARGKRVGHRGVPHPPGATAARAGAPVREERRPSCAEPMQRLGDGGKGITTALHWSPSQKDRAKLADIRLALDVRLHGSSRDRRRHTSPKARRRRRFPREKHTT